MLKFMMKNPVSLIMRMSRTLKEFSHAGFISTAISEGLYDLLLQGHMSLQDIRSGMGKDID